MTRADLEIQMKKGQTGKEHTGYTPARPPKRPPLKPPKESGEK